MTKEKLSKIVIEPSEKVIETLRLAVVRMPLDELFQRTGATSELLEKWINGEEWIPLHVIKEACDINKESPEAPPYTKTLSECTAGVSFKILMEEAVKKPPAEEEIIPSAISLGKKADKKPEVSRQMIKKSAALILILTLIVLVGFSLGGFMGAIIGAIFGYVIIITLTFMFFVSHRKRRKS